MVLGIKKVRKVSPVLDGLHLQKETVNFCVNLVDVLCGVKEVM